MIGRTNTGGGGGLNFKVVGGTTAPSNPKENMIWVNTSVAITTWVFSATVPENPVQGMVWLCTGTSSTAAFNALKKNAIAVYPISAKQCVSGAWLDKNAESYQNGKWVDWWGGWLYRNGNEYVDVTGGWGFKNNCGDSLQKNADSMYLHTWGKSSTYGHAVVYTKNPIDLTGFTKLVVKTTDWHNTGGEIFPRIGVCSYIPDDYQELKDGLAAYIASGTELDISGLSGEYYVLFGCAIGGNTSLNHYITVNEMQLK